jgi:ABC-2 type transport system permease protein
MNIESNTIPASRRFYWSIRRELWENRSIYIAPIVVAIVFVIGFLINIPGLPQRIRLGSNSAAELHQLIEQPYTLVAFVLMGVSFVIAVVYCLDALYGERRDRSILFWKSLPVSDAETVLCKASIAVVILPLLTLLLTVVTQLLMLLLSTGILIASGMSSAAVTDHLGLFDMWRMLSVHLLAGHGLWYAPIYAWLLLVSAWARRTPFLWAILPFFAIAVLERIIFNTSYLAAMLRSRLLGGPDNGAASGMSMEAMASPSLIEMLSSPGLWTGLLLAAVLLAAAAQLRRYRGPM